MTSISKNSAITFSSQIFIFVLGLITSIILARVLGPTGKGIYVLIVLIPAVILKLGSLGIGAANIYFTGSKRYTIKDIVSNSLSAGILLGLILISLFFGVSRLSVFQNFLNSNQINPLYLWLIVFTVPLSLLVGFFRSVFLGKEEIIRYNEIGVFQNTLQLVTIILFLLVLRRGIFGAVFSYVLSICGASLFVILLIRKITKINLSYNRKLLKDSTKYGLKAYFGNLAQFLNYRLDMLLAAVFLAPGAVGYYSIAVGIAEKLWMLPGAIAIVLFPRISSLKDVEANNLTPTVARHTFLIILILSLALAVLAKPLIKILFGSAFLPSVAPLLILLPGIIALSISKVLSAHLAGRRKPQFGAYASSTSLAVNVPLNLWLIPKWGISGAAFASSVAYTVATLMVIIVFVKISKKSWSETLLIKKQDFRDYKNFLLELRSGILNSVFHV